MKFKLLEKKEETADTTTFIFKPPTGFTWRAGQYLFYTLPTGNPDNRGITRYFTISSAPSERNVRITTRINTKSSTFKQTLNKLKIGNEIEASGPDGDFVVDSDLIGVSDPKRSLIFIAGGIGITPFRSILVDFASRNLKPDVQLLYSNHDENIVFKDELESLKTQNPNLKINYILSPSHIDAKTISTIPYSLNATNFFISGPSPFVRTIRDIILSQGVKKEDLKLDFFPGYS